VTAWANSDCYGRINRPAAGNINLTLAFASGIFDLRHILADAPWTGTGAGTFASLLPICQDAGDTVANPVARPPALQSPFDAPMLWMIVITVLFAIFVLVRLALKRGATRSI
jgi:hypothetical protein